MIQIGRMNVLTIKRIRQYELVLDGGESRDIILPIKYARKDCKPGDNVEVFAYVDKNGRSRATTDKPHALVGQFARLKVVANSSSGSYLDWGLQKDLLVPKSEQQVKMEEGKSYIVYVFLEEKTNRIAASSKLEKFLGYYPPDYAEEDEVDLLIVSKTDLGYKAIVDNAHWGVVYKNEVFRKIKVGDKLRGYIKKVRDDLKLDLSINKAGHQKVSGVSQEIYNTIREMGGTVTITDKSKPEEIYSLFGVSKKTFKKAVGALYKRRLISIGSSAIKLLEK